MTWETISGAVIFVAIMLGVTSVSLGVVSFKYPMRGMQNGRYRRRDAAAKASAGYLDRHPNLKAGLYDWDAEEDAA